MPIPATTRSQRLRKTKAQLIDEIETLEQREAATPEGGRELKRREQELAEKEAQLRIVLDNMPGGILLADRDQNYVLFNGQYSELHDYPERFLKVGTSLREEARFQADRGDFGPTDKDDLIEQVIATYQRGKAVSYERAIAGSGRTLHFNVAPTPEGGYVTIVTDITDRKRMEKALAEKEAQLRVALDNMPGALVYTDEELNIVFSSDRLADMYPAPRELLQPGCPYPNYMRYLAEHGFYGEGDVDAFVAERVESLRNPSDKTSETHTPDGHIYQVRRRAAAGGTVSVMADITDRKRAEEALQAAHGIIKAQKERMESELNVGHEIQMSMIPLVFPPFPDHDEFSVFAALEPAREVGGDFYDYYFIDEERICFCIGDVSGKGVPAALFMAMARTLIKSRAVDDRSTASILTHVNDELSADNQSCMFVTVFAVILNIRTGELLYTNAGHNPPYIKRNDGALQCLDQRHGPVIGAVEGMVYAEGRDTMAPGDLLLLFTDGVTEAMDVEDRLFSEDRLEQLLTAMDTDDADKVVDNTVAAVKAFAGEAEQADDITILALAFHGRPEDALRAE